VPLGAAHEGKSAERDEDDAGEGEMENWSDGILAQDHVFGLVVVHASPNLSLYVIEGQHGLHKFRKLLQTLHLIVESSQRHCFFFFFALFNKKNLSSSLYNR